MVPTQPVKQTPTPEAETVEAARPSPKFTLGEEKFAELRKVSKTSARRRSEPAAVSCQCDWKGEEEDMVSKQLRFRPIEAVLNLLDCVQLLQFAATPTLLWLCGCV